MLDELRVANLGIIADAHIEPGPGLVVVSGETGAGKTMLLGALQLLTGMPARSGLVGPGSDEASVSGRFVVGETEVVVARRLAREGRSRAYLDGEMAPLTRISEATAGIVEVVGQHDHLSITKPREVRALVDACLDGAGRDALEAYRSAWARLRELEATRDELGGDPRALERERALAEWQAEEIGSAGFTSGDDERIEAEVRRLRHAEELAELIGRAHEDLEAAGEASGRARAALERAERIDSELAALASDIRGPEEILTEVRSDLARRLDDANERGGDLDAAERRVATLNDLRRKYGATLDDVLRFGEAAAKRASELAGLIERADTIGVAIEEAVAAVEAAGRRLTEVRSQAAERLVASARAHLGDLGFDRPRLEVVFDRRDAHADGTDRLELWFASDERLEAAPVSKVASGGELSRLVLSLRLAGGAASAPVVAFDEIDAGVGGRTGIALGRKMSELATSRQVLAVTHLPQIAAFADTHIVVERVGAEARVRLLSEEERVSELARMLAGLDDVPEGLDHATELLRTARAAKVGSS